MKDNKVLSSTPGNLSGVSRVPQTFAALRYPNYRLWFIGQIVSLVGTWMQATAQGFLVYQITQSPAFLGYVGFASGLPSWMFTLYAGLIADRISRRALLVITQTVMMILAFLLAGLVFTGIVQPLHIIALAFLLGVANAFDAPARQAFVVELVEREDLTNAIALNASMFNLGAIVGPMFASFTYAALGAAWCFVINGISFLAVIGALLLMKIQPIEHISRDVSALEQLKEGIHFVASNKVILTLIAAAGMISMFGMGLITLIPAWAVDVLHGDVRTNGLLLAARGGGALIGALVIASIGRRKIRGMMLSIGIVLMPVFFGLFALLPWLTLSLIMLALIGLTFMMALNSANALVQTNVPDHLRGRIMSIYTLTFLGGVPIGSLLAGALASALSEPDAVIICSIILLIFAVYLWIRKPELRTIG